MKVYSETKSVEFQLKFKKTDKVNILIIDLVNIIIYLNINNLY